MRNAVFLSGALVILLALAAPAQAGCDTCKAAQTDDGWCAQCKVGYFDGVAIKSKRLYDALAGQRVDLKTIRCPGCAAAAKDGGVCERCKISYTAGKAYKSNVAAPLARGQAKDPQTIKCSICKKDAADHGWCDGCKVGLVGPRAFKDKQAYQDAVAARKILLAAAKTSDKCSDCAVAMVSDGTCASCKVSYRNGRKVAAKPKAPGK